MYILFIFFKPLVIPVVIAFLSAHNPKLYDEFSKPFDLKNGFPDKRELGNKYNLLTNYKNHEIYREDSRTRIKI